MTILLDSDALIALAFKDHVHYKAVYSWFRSIRHFAVCPITQGALARYIYRVSGKDSEGVRAAMEWLAESDGFEFWPDDISYQVADLSRVTGYKQVTDAYLVGLAAAHQGRLATLDKSLANVNPEALLIS
jgi:predicted nucleic acid-binding protein